MRSYLLGSVVLFVAGIVPVVADDTKTSVAKSIDGTWTVLCLEKNGQPVPDSKGMTVKAEGSTITCTGRDGKPAMTLKLDFGQNGTVKVTESASNSSAGNSSTSENAKAGVYVRTQDFLAICVHDGDAQRGANGRTAVDGNQTKSHCTIILRREGVRSNGDK